MFRILISVSLLALLNMTAAAQPKPVVADSGTVYKVPYRLTETLHMVVRVKLNGKGPYNLIIDTGAPMVVITTKVAKEAGAVTEDSGWSTVETFELEGGAKLHNVQMLAEDIFQLKGMNGMGLAGRPLHGVIGYTILSQYKTEFDLQKGFMSWTRLDSEIPKLIPLRRDKDGKPLTGTPELNALGGFMQSVGTSLTGTNRKTIQRGSFGIEVEPAEDSEGIRVTKVYPKTPAALAEIQQGDLIKKIGRKRTSTLKRLLQAASQVAAEQSVKVVIERNGEELELEVTAGKGF